MRGMCKTNTPDKRVAKVFTKAKFPRWIKKELKIFLYHAKYRGSREKEKAVVAAEYSLPSPRTSHFKYVSMFRRRDCHKKGLHNDSSK